MGRVYRNFDANYMENVEKAVEAYAKGEMSVTAICSTFDISNGTLCNEIKKCNIPQRKPGKRMRSKFIKCTKCGNDKNIRGAKFCFNCGADIRDNILILIDKLQDALANTKFLPDGIREDVSETIREAMAEFKKVVK